MGGKQSKNNPQKDKQALAEFLKGKANLDKIWKRFDRDGNGFIDEKELEDLIYCALCFFCTERDPNMPEPPREQCQPFVNKIIMDLKPTLDENDDGVISREEFELFGQYLNGEYEKLQKEMEQQQQQQQQQQHDKNKKVKK
eukprot:CAMPEP_0202704194 /NCGR_PEP_ID=MMETSP1385-20130828/16919_1 /ASSEMBLY_ACC=CAM_ASM_000861 /TAXON_ID=933848 /ORGANISM="Elphidium margaritaceum" /LENGTH=140 /DNA_ID=CAMNT_0049362165 /DNA_START=90 /DNA_END=512 /DNA_ORIENTATION=-